MKRAMAVSVKSKVQVWPNPASESLTVHFDSERTGNISIADLTGKVWLTGSKAAGQRAFEMNIRHLPAGVYVVSFQSEAGYQVTKKLVVQH
jgi:hypothetical protein